MQTHSVPTSDINPQRLHSLHRNTHGEHHANMLGVMSQGYHGDASCMLNPPILNSCSYNADHDQWATVVTTHVSCKKNRFYAMGIPQHILLWRAKSVNSKLITSVVLYGSSNSVLSQGTWSESRQSSFVEGLFQEAAVNVFTQKSFYKQLPLFQVMLIDSNHGLQWIALVPSQQVALAGFETYVSEHTQGVPVINDYWLDKMI